MWHLTFTNKYGVHCDIARPTFNELTKVCREQIGEGATGMRTEYRNEPELRKRYDEAKHIEAVLTHQQQREKEKREREARNT